MVPALKNNNDFTELEGSTFSLWHLDLGSQLAKAPGFQTPKHNTIFCQCFSDLIKKKNLHALPSWLFFGVYLRHVKGQRAFLHLTSIAWLSPKCLFKHLPNAFTVHLKRARREDSKYIHEKERWKCRWMSTLVNHLIITQSIQRETSHWRHLCELPIGSRLDCARASVTHLSTVCAYNMVTHPAKYQDCKLHLNLQYEWLFFFISLANI